MYKYYGFGLNILSEIEMPEFIKGEFNEHDLQISLADVPDKLNDTNAINKSFSSFGDNEYLQNARDIAKYYASGGNSIKIMPYTGVDEKSIRVFLLGSPIAAILYQRGQVPLHASGILKDGKLIVFCGHSGAGKSTLLANLSKKGYTIFTDDVCVLSKKEDGKVYGTASYPIIKLWEDSMNDLKSEKFNKEYRIRPELLKYGQFFHQDFLTGNFPISKIFILNSDNRHSEITCKAIDGMSGFKILEKQAYRYKFATGETLRNMHFSYMISLSTTVPIYEVNRPVKRIPVKALSEIIEQYL